MSTLLFANNAQTTLAGPVASGALSVNLAAGTGSEFPSPTAGQYFVMTFTDAATKLLHEIVQVTARSGDTLTIVRAQEGTSAQSWVAGDIAGNWWTAGSAATMVQVQTLQTQPGNYAVDTGSTNSIQIALNPAPATLATITGAPIRVLVAHTNTGATTLTIQGLASTAVFAQAGSGALPAGSVTIGQIYEFIYTPSLGFEVVTPKVLLSIANTWTATQTAANSVFWSGLTTGGSPQRIAGVDSSNQTTMAAGPSGGAAWRVTDNSTSTNLMSLGATGLLNVVGGLGATTGNIIAAAGNVNAPTGIVSGQSLQAGASGIVSASGSTGTNAATRVPTLADFGAAGNPTAWHVNIPAFGFSAASTMLLQGGVISVPANDTPTTFNLPMAFPAQFLGIVISYGAITPPVLPQIGVIGAQPLNLSQFQATNSSTAGVSNGCFYFAIGF